MGTDFDGGFQWLCNSRILNWGPILEDQDLLWNSNVLCIPLAPSTNIMRTLRFYIGNDW